MCFDEGAVSRRERLYSNSVLMGAMTRKATQEISACNLISGRLSRKLLFSGNYLFHKVPKQKVSL
jgi:hypothetical protein